MLGEVERTGSRGNREKRNSMVHEVAQPSARLPFHAWLRCRGQGLAFGMGWAVDASADYYLNMAHWITKIMTVIMSLRH